ncbi:MAG: response regulator [candidate division KSB1 bacterium]|nr:response regulator [candidate division KSB1 bacterium]
MKTRTLFVEDERWGVTPYFKELESHDFECTLALNGDEAIKMLQSRPFDLVSMDVMFPPGKSLGRNTTAINAGIRLLEYIRRGKIKNCAPQTKVVILTAVMNREIEAAIKKIGVSAYLTKPIEFNKVIETFCQLRDDADKEVS